MVTVLSTPISDMFDYFRALKKNLYASLEHICGSQIGMQPVSFFFF